MSFKRYPAYKDSGISGIGQIPEHWKTPRLKVLARIRNGRDYKNVETEGEGYPVIGSGGAFARATKYLHCGPSVLLGRKGTVDKPLLLSEPFWTVDTMFYTDIERSTDPRFLYYSALTIEFKALSTNTALPSMAQEDLANIFMATPDRADQETISSFLDHETAKIDALVAEQKRLIELLKEKRQAVISHAVTKGLDPNVPMKDSGVEWLGDIPAHWRVTAIKHALETPITDGPHETPEFQDDGVPFVSAEAVSTGVIDFSKAKYISQSDHDRYSKKCKPKLGDIFIVKSGATTGISAKLDVGIEFNIWSPLALLRCDDFDDENYLLLVIRSAGFQAAIELYWNFGTQQNIGMGTLENLRMPRPPAAEQLSIAQYVVEKNSHLSALELQAQQAIVLMAERRSALISAAVTGKIDVRGWKPPRLTETISREATETI